MTKSIGLLKNISLLLLALQVAWARADFEWPEGPIPKNCLPHLAVEYSEKVRTCYGGEHTETGEKLWAEGRLDSWKGFEDLRESLTARSLKRYKNVSLARDFLCKEVRHSLVETKYDGCQFGNCEEGAFVLYCLAHQAGFKNLMICETSKNDHVFAAFLNPRALSESTDFEDDICVLDRSDLGYGNFFCGVDIKEGDLRVKKKKTRVSHYQNITCSDSLIWSQIPRIRPGGSLKAKQWKKYYSW